MDGGGSVKRPWLVEKYWDKDAKSQGWEQLAAFESWLHDKLPRAEAKEELEESAYIETDLYGIFCDIYDGMKGNEWISVEDRLPEEGECVLGWDVDDRAKEALIAVTDHGWRIYGPSGLVKAHVTHWQPLPDGPNS
jgi:hypothetical protein